MFLHESISFEIIRDSLRPFLFWWILYPLTIATPPYYVIFNENHLATIINTLPIYIFIAKYQHPSFINYPLQLSYQK